MDERERLFRQMINENKEKIYRICIYHASCREDCEDMFQQVLINIWSSLPNFRGDSKVSTWIYRIALNTTIDFNRAESRRMKNHQQLMQEFRLVSGQDDRWEKLRKEKMLDEIHSQIIQLSVIDKLIMSLFMEELSSREIAGVVGISEGNVRIKIHRIRESLKSILGGQNHE
ncbi:MAG: RNA polymerase sigma factor [Bacteroidales bacterium]|nr:RNA polymerase sigma factor [Bacteroidales bacterium]